MAKYSVELRTLLNNPETKAAIDKALSTYPLYQKRSKEEYIPSYIPTREELNKKILNHYKYREIVFDTVGRFIDELEIAMCEIMPYYNQLFFSADQDYNILYNVDYVKQIKANKEGSATTTSTENGTSSSNGTSNTSASDNSTATNESNNNGKNVEVDTPQGLIDIPESNADNVDYASKVNLSKNNDTGTTTTNGESSSNSTSTQSVNNQNELNATGTNNESEEMEEITKGNYGQMSYQSLLQKYRELIINVEQKIINDTRIKELFYQVF